MATAARETKKALVKSGEGRSIGDLEHADYNPRKIGDRALHVLGEAMVRFGDLSGIVFNRRTGRLIGGHQRTKHLDQSVYDPFLGSGTTLIAAEQTARICYGMELDPGYCDVIRRRYAEFTNQPKLAP